MSGLDINRFSFYGNEIHGSFADYVVYVKPSITNDWKKEWCVIFSKSGRYNNIESKPILCSTLEEAFDLIEEYTKQVMFDDLMKELGENYES